ncbi:MAG: OsmC family protein [Acidobacteriota bacterium]
MTIRIHPISASASEATIRGHKVTIDRPSDKGGTDAAPMGGELFLASAGGCFMSNLLAAIKAREAQVSGIQLDVIAKMEGTPARFTGLTLQVSAECDDRALLEKLVEIADRGCIMMNTLRGKLDLEIRLAATRESGA